MGLWPGHRKRRAEKMQRYKEALEEIAGFEQSQCVFAINVAKEALK